MRVSVLIAAAYLTSACYNFRPLETPSPDAGAYVAATLSDSGSVELARYLGPDVFVVRGRYLGSGADERGLAVSVAEVETKRGDEVSWRGETITLPVDAIARWRCAASTRGAAIWWPAWVRRGSLPQPLRSP